MARPVERFLNVESASSLVLLGAAAVAMLWANSPWRDGYESLWAAAVLGHDLRFWINDGLMAIFFLVVGLEIRREIAGGELSTLKRAALPLAAALGGMILPAGLYLTINAGAPSARGWGTPMATDIAFAVGVLALLGPRVPPALRVLLLALAVIDDIGAVIVISVFYSGHLAPLGFLIVALGVAAILAAQRLGVRRPWAYLPMGVAIWIGAFESGVHPALAGVLVGLLLPSRETVLRALHGWVAFGVMPLFALANAGVAVSFGGGETPVLLGVVAGLVVGKPLGITGLSWLCVRLGWAELPRGVTWPMVGVVGLAGGIGFTMAIFIAQLAFTGAAQLETAKLGILVGSFAAGLLAIAAGRAVLPSAGGDGLAGRGAQGGVELVEPGAEGGDARQVGEHAQEDGALAGDGPRPG